MKAINKHHSDEGNAQFEGDFQKRNEHMITVWTDIAEKTILMHECHKVFDSLTIALNSVYAYNGTFAREINGYAIGDNNSIKIAEYYTSTIYHT